MENHNQNISRRDALRQVSLLLGSSVIGGQLFLAGCAEPENQKKAVELFPQNLLDEIGEVILPKSEKSPGAKEAEVGKFINQVVPHCYSREEQDILKNGIDTIDGLAADLYDRPFLKLTENQKFDLIYKLDVEAREQTGSSVHFFTMIKQLTLLGYFTSEAGVTKALKYNPVPGGYRGCESYENGEPAWFGPLSSLG